MIIDGHCDVLMKLYMDKQLEFSQDHPEMQASLHKLLQGGVKLQFCAIFIDQDVVRTPNFEHILEYVDLFYGKIINNAKMQAVRSREELAAVMNSDRVGALLTIEGADALAGNPLLLRTAYRLGVRAIGLTWNWANWAADGAKEPREGGLTQLGKRFVRECDELGMLLDVSHLSERAFWDLVETSVQPLFASHSNVYDLYPHPRNLKQDQIATLIERTGLIGLTFVPYFVSGHERVTIDDLLRHLDFVCSIGGVRQVAFGSDFDGITETIVGLENAAQYSNLANELYKRYKPEEAKGFLFDNWHRFLQENLPRKEVY